MEKLYQATLYAREFGEDHSSPQFVTEDKELADNWALKYNRIFDENVDRLQEYFKDEDYSKPKPFMYDDIVYNATKARVSEIELRMGKGRDLPRGINIVHVGDGRNINEVYLEALITDEELKPIIVCIDGPKGSEPVDILLKNFTREIGRYEPMIKAIPEAKHNQHDKYRNRHHNKSKW